MTIGEILTRLVSGNTLSALQAEFLLEELLQGRMDASQMGAALSLIQQRGVTVEELVGAAGVMRRHATPVPVPEELQREIIDTCGTGGAPKLFNVSTIAAIVAAGAGVKVVKHGNRSRTGRGSAEILQSLGVQIEATPAVQAKCLQEAGICFCFAIHHHPATRNASATRKALEFPTIFNLLGPLTNPGRAKRQLLGVANRDHVRIVAEALAQLGTIRAMVVHSSDGFDELSTTAQNLVAHVENGSVRMVTLDAAEFGLRRASVKDLQAETLADATAIVRAVLSGAEGPKTEIVLLNAASALFVAGKVESVREGLALAAESIASGNAAKVLEQLARTSHVQP